MPPGFAACAIGAAAGAGVLWLIRWAWKRATGVDGMGLGDVKMLAMIGAFLGWQDVWLVLLFASVAGAVVGVTIAVGGGGSVKGRMQSKLPFGTFLAVAALVASFALIPLVRLTSLRSLLGTYVNRRGTTVTAIAIAALIIALNAALIVITLAG